MLLIYGSTGYTGGLVVEQVLARGIPAVLAGRDPTKLAALSEKTGLPTRVFAVDHPELDGATVLLNCAGPFVRTAGPLVDACLRARVHYLDITGEIAVFEDLARRDAAARAAGVLVLPGVGFDVVPSDCLAAHLAARLPGATRLTLGIWTAGSLSHGTANTIMANLSTGGAVRKDGRVIAVPAAFRTREIDFGSGPRQAVTIPWGDVSTAWYTTGIGDIEVYAVLPSPLVWGLRASNLLGPILGAGPVRAFLQRRVNAMPRGPDEPQRAGGWGRLWGEVTRPDGGRAEARLSTPEGYTLTAHTAAEAARRVFVGVDRVGFGTPAGVFGADFVLGFDGVTREDAP
jgi:short subunit dehydrogenase-like uncharacterized protein